MPNGTLLFQTRPHSIVLVGYALLIFALLMGLILISPPLPSWVPLVASGVVLTVFLLDYFGTIYEATTETVTKRQGILWLREERIPLSGIQDLKFSTGILGLLLGFGRLEIESAGTEGKIVFSFLPTWAYRLLRPVRRALGRRYP